MKKRYANFKFLIAPVLLAFFALPAVTGQATLMHSYTFEDGTAADVAGTANGTLNGTGYTVADGAFTATTNGDFISFDAATLALNTYTTITMEVYLRAGNGTNPGWTVLAYFGGNAGNNAHFMSIARGDNRSQTEYVGAATAIGPELDDGKLHHLVSILTATDLSFYIDGELMQTVAHTKSLSEINLENAWLGKGGWAADPTWNGSIYEFNIYEGALDATTVLSNSTAFLSASDARLSSLTTDIGTLTPEFSSLSTHYAVAVPEGTTTVNVTPTANATGAVVTGGGAVDVSAGPATATIGVTSEDGTETMSYTVDILFENPGCFVPLYDDRQNMIPDPEMTDITKYQGWGHKRIAYGHEAYCGLSVMKFDAVTNGWPEGAAMDVNDIAWNPNSAYRVRFMYKTMDGSLGLLANQADPNFLIPLPATEGEWMEIDTVFHTGANPGTSFLSINNVDASSTAKVAYIDNYELYEVSMNTELADLTVNGSTVTGFDPAIMSYDVVLPDYDVPVVDGTPAAAFATIVVNDAEKVPGSTTIDVIAEDGTTTGTYTINFTGTPATMMHSYTFEDGTANDVVGTAHGTVVAGTIANGAYTAATAGDIIELPAADIAINTYTAVTLEGYILADVDNTGATMMAYFGGNENNVGGNGYFFTPDRWTESRTGISCGNITKPWTVEEGVTGAPVSVGDKHHLVSVLTAANIKWYIDGVLVGTSPLTGDNAIGNLSNANAWLCKGGYTNDPTWLGTIHEFNIYQGELNSTTVADRASAFLNSSDATLSELIVDVGTLTPAFATATTHYAIAVPEGTTTVNLAAAATITGATVTGTGAVDISGGSLTHSIEVTSVDATVTKTYTVDILIGIDENCFTPLYDDRTNMIPDPEMTDVSLYQGWGHKRIAYGFEAYCGLSVMKFDAVTNGWPDGAALDVNDIAWNANSAYRVRFMYKTMDGSLGLLANQADPNFLMPLPATEGEWMEIDTVFHTGANPGTSFITINNVDASSTAKLAYIDNYELYEVSTDTTLSDLQVDGTTVPGFDAATSSYDVQLAAGTTVVPTVTATATGTNATVEVTDATGLPGTTTVLVTAEDGVSTSTYEINFSVILSDDATLSDLQVNGSTVEGFDPAITSYDVELPAGTTDVPVVTATTNDVNATAVVTDAADLPGSTIVNVTAEDGATSTTYTINFTLDTGIGLDPAGAISVYPSVSKGSFTVKTPGPAAEITVYDLYGKIVLEQFAASSEQIVALPQTGMYIMNVKSGGVSKSFKLIRTN
ncbi:MAG: cadherin-like beta sandwich domain-containing protein [Bacteroidales bacterium]|nr:cadherin-like beta sandwich domain-containing protein [Bacteroidales bacterium]